VTATIEQLIAFVSANAWLAYLTIFLAALLEAVPVFGSLVPGATIILALGTLTANGELNLLIAVACAFIGALLGDGSSFWVGHLKQRSILTAWPLSRYPGIVDQSERFFNRYGALAVFFARFVGPVRAIVPITAGALAMPPAKFYAIAAAATLTWAFAHILPGALAGTVLERIGGWAGLGASAKHYWMPLVLAGGLLAGLVVWFIRRRRGVNVPVRKRPADKHPSPM
jgi:membrane-associated protein